MHILKLRGKTGCDVMDRVRRLIRCNQESVTPYTGKGIYIAVLDSGVFLHPDLVDRIVAFRDFTDKHRGTAWEQENMERAYDDNGHGTHV